MRVVRALRQDFIEVAPHLTCIGLSKTAIFDLPNNDQFLGIKRIVALRGDLPLDEDITNGDFNQANDLFAYIRKLTGDYFHIEVAPYPEFHPETRTVQEALKNFQQKIAAAANGEQLRNIFIIAMLILYYIMLMCVETWELKHPLFLESCPSAILIS